MRRTLAWRLLRTLLAVGLVATLVATVFFIAAPVAGRGSSGLDRDIAVVAPLHDVLSPSAYAAYLVARSSPDLDRGIEYTLRLADGAVIVGAQPVPLLHPSSRSGFLEYVPAVHGADIDPRLALRQCFANGDCLIVGDRIEKRLALVRHSVLMTLIVFLTGLGIAAVQLFFAARIASRDIERTNCAIESLLDGDLAQRLPAGMGTGLNAISGKFNRLLERIEHLTLANRTVIDSTAHDLRAPLYRLRTRLETGLLKGRSLEHMSDTVEAALNEVDRIEATLDALLRITLAESGTASFASVNVAEVTADVVELYRPIAEDKHLQLTAELPVSGITRANAQLLAQAIANLLDNAIKYTPMGGVIGVQVIRRSDSLVVRVTDSGPGIAVADRARAVERSTRLYNAAGTPGSGLGLALVVAVARLHGGHLELSDNSPGLIAEIVIPVTLPRAAAPTV